MFQKWIGIVCLGVLLVETAPQAAASDQASSSLTVDRFWHPEPTGGPPIIINSIEDAPDGFWVLLGAGVDTLYRFRADTLAATAAPPLPTFNSATMLATPQAVYVVATHSMSNQPKTISLHRYDIAMHAWENRDEEGISRLFDIGGHLYFTFHDASPSGGHEDAIGSYDWAADQKTVLASNRRVPAQTQFDSKPSFRVENLFAGPEGKPCALIDYVPYVIQEEPGDWPSLFHFNVWYEPDGSRTFAGRTLLSGAINSQGNPFAVTEIDSSHSQPEELLGIPQPLPPDAKSPGTPLVADTPGPDWARQPIWPGDYGSGKRYAFALHNDDLLAFSSQREGGGRYSLLWFQPGKADPLRIPLRFVFDEATKALLPALCNNLAPMVADPETTRMEITLVPTSQGLCFKPIAGGFWFLSYADLDTYATQHGLTSAATGAAVQISP